MFAALLSASANLLRSRKFQNSISWLHSSSTTGLAQSIYISLGKTRIMSGLSDLALLPTTALELLIYWYGSRLELNLIHRNIRPYVAARNILSETLSSKCSIELMSIS